MDIKNRFQDYLHQSLAVDAQDTFLLAVSGGRDSMLMAHLFVSSRYTCVIAHCNFHLRAEESDRDEALVRKYTEDQGLPFFVEQFQTEAYAKENGISIQMAARDLRYAWFRRLKAEQGLTWICIAQHQNDHIETVFVNLTRGTGLAGLQGIQAKRDDLIRPLLFLTAEEVIAYVRAESIPYRDDQSNFSAKYARNKVRLEIIPKFKEISADFEATMLDNILHFQEAHALLQSFISPIREALFIKSGEGFKIEKAELKAYVGNMPLLYELFRPYGFVKQILLDVLAQWDGEAGKVFHAPKYRLLMDRHYFFLEPHNVGSVELPALNIEADAKAFTFGGYDFTLSVSDSLSILRDPTIAQIDEDKLVFPLTLRYWREGDYFYPLGMEGRKKLSDFFVGQKLNRFAKNRVPILINGNAEIIWLVNLRLDNRYKMTESTKKVVTLVCKLEL